MCGMYICFYTSGGILYTVNKTCICAKLSTSKKQYQSLTGCLTSETRPSVMFPGPWTYGLFLEFFCFLVVINFVFWFSFFVWHLSFCCWFPCLLLAPWFLFVVQSWLLVSLPFCLFVKFVFLFLKRKKRCIHTDRNLQCPERRQTSGLVRTQPPKGGEENSGLLYHRHGPGTAPWLLCGLGRNLLTCLAPQPTHLCMHTNTIQFLIADITGSVTVITLLD